METRVVFRTQPTGAGAGGVVFLKMGGLAYYIKVFFEIHHDAA